MPGPQVTTGLLRRPTLAIVFLALTLVGVVGLVGCDADGGSPTTDARTAPSVPADSVPPTPSAPRAVAWEGRSDVAPVAGGAGLVVVQGIRVVGLDGVTGEERWYHDDPAVTPTDLTATRDGGIVVVRAEDDRVLRSFDAFTGELLMTLDEDADPEAALALDGSASLGTVGDLLVLDRVYAGQGNVVTLLDLETGEVARSLDTATHCGGPDPYPSVEVAADVLVIACWKPDAADAGRGTYLVRSGTLVVTGVDPTDGSVRWRAPGRGFRSESPQGSSETPKPSSALEVSSDGAYGLVSWEVPQGSFTRGGRAQVLDLADGRPVGVPTSGRLVLGSLYATGDRLLDLREPAARLTCPVATSSPADCFSNSSPGSTRAVRTGSHWVGPCDLGEDLPTLDLRSGRVCVLSLLAGGGGERDTSVVVGDPDTGDLDVLSAPGAVVATTYDGDDYDVVALR